LNRARRFVSALYCLDLSATFEAIANPVILKAKLTRAACKLGRAMEYRREPQRLRDLNPIH